MKKCCISLLQSHFDMISYRYKLGPVAKFLVAKLNQLLLCYVHFYEGLNQSYYVIIGWGGGEERGWMMCRSVLHEALPALGEGLSKSRNSILNHNIIKLIAN